jgi:hypothetical protein
MFCVLNHLWVSEPWRPWKKLKKRNKKTEVGFWSNSQYLIMFIDIFISSSANSRSVDSESDGSAREINHSPRHQACKYNPHVRSFYCQSALFVKLLSTHRWSPSIMQITINYDHLRPNKLWKYVVITLKMNIFYSEWTAKLRAWIERWSRYRILLRFWTSETIPW